jgi:hypothetical protein
MDFNIMMLRIILFTVLLLLNTDAIAFAASTFRCGPNVVNAGDTDQEVIRKCGEPTSKQVTGEKTTGYSKGTGDWESIDVTKRGNEKARTTPLEGYYSEVSQKIEAWDYNCGANRFSMTLIFLGHTLNIIEQQGYGSGESYCNGADRNPNRKKSEIDMREQELQNKKLRTEIERQKEETYQTRKASDIEDIERAEERAEKTRGLVTEEKATYENKLLEDAIRGVYTGNIKAIQDYFDMNSIRGISIKQFKNNPDGSVWVDFGNGNTVTFDSAEDFISKILTPAKYYDYSK